MEDNSLAKNIESRLCQILDKTGMYYRIFSRQKSIPSIQKKLDSKGAEYKEKGKKMQDFVGIRVVFYFKDDIEVFLNILRKSPNYDPKNESNSIIELSSLEQNILERGDSQLNRLLPLTDKIFMPERLNLVMKMEEFETELFMEQMNSQVNYDANLIDNTYEIQLRTVLSEGWHEVEHDLRYKTREENWWSDCKNESRLLNGIYAALISNESQLANIVDDIAYKAYKSKEWDAMIRFHYRRRTSESKLSVVISDYLNSNKDVAKKIFRCDRVQLISGLHMIPLKLEISTDLIVFIINRLAISDEEILKMEPRVITNVLDKTFGSFKKMHS